MNPQKVILSFRGTKRGEIFHCFKISPCGRNDMTGVLRLLTNSPLIDDLVKSSFSSSLAGGDEGEGEKRRLNPVIYHPHPNPPPSRGREFLTFYEIIIYCISDILKQEKSQGGFNGIWQYELTFRSPVLFYPP